MRDLRTALTRRPGLRNKTRKARFVASSGLRRQAVLWFRLQQQLLHPPVGGFRDVEFGRRRTGELVASRKLLEVAAGLADHTQDLAFEGHFEDARGISGFADEHHLVLAG